MGKRYYGIVVLIVFLIFASYVSVFSEGLGDNQAPTSPLITKIDTGYSSPKAIILWESSTDNVKVSGYKIYRDEVEIGFAKRRIFIDQNVEFLKAYNYKVVAVDTSNNLSEPCIKEVTIVDKKAPTRPVNLKYSISRNNEVALSWDQSSDNVTLKEYIIYRNFEEIARTTVNSYTDNNLNGSTSYTYSIKAVDSSNNTSRMSKAIRVKIIVVTENTDVPANVETPTITDNIQLTCTKVNNSIVLNWNSVNGCSNYNVYKSTDNGTYESIATYSTTTYTDSSLESGKQYSYKVSSESGNQVVNSNNVEVTYVSSTNLSGTISKDTTLDSIQSPYIVGQNVVIPEGVTVTIMPGTILKFNPEVGISLKGKIIAHGTVDYPITFTSTYENPIRNYNRNDYWAGINIETTGEMDCSNINVSYAANNYAGIISCDGLLNIKNSNISSSSFYKPGIYLGANSTSNIEHCVFTMCSSGCISVETNKAAGIRDNTVDTILLKYNSSAKVDISNNNIKASIEVLQCNDGTLSINQNNFLGQYGVLIQLNGLNCTADSLYNRMSSNIYKSGTAVVAIRGVNTKDTTLPNTINTYIVAGNITINNNTTLKINNGVTLKFPENLGIDVQGKLEACGNLDSPVKFTSIYENPVYYLNGNNQYWKGISVKSTGEMAGDYITIQHGGTNNNANIYVEGKLSLTNSQITKSLSYTDGIYFKTNIQPILKNNYIFGNSNYGIKNENSNIVIDASFNYWGSIYGPSVYSSITSSWESNGDKVGSNIIYSPWIGQELISQIHYSEEEVSISGNYSKSYNDFEFDLKGFNIDISRTYNSGSQEESLLGKGWHFGLQANIKSYNEYSNLYVVELPNGAIQTFTQKGDSFTANDSRSVLQKVGDEFALTTKEQNVYGFNKAGLLYYVKDKNDNTLNIQLDSQGKILSICDSAGRKITMQYNIDGLIESLTDPMGRAIVYSYNKKQLSSVEGTLGCNTFYIYDESGLLIKILDTDMETMEEVAYSNVNGICRMTQKIDSFKNTFNYTYDDTAHTITITDSLGKSTIQKFDNYMYPILFKDEEGKDTITEYFLYENNVNKYGELKSTTDRNGNKTSYLRDSRGNVSKVTYPDSSTKEFLYDDKNNLLMEKDQVGKCAYYVHDAQKKNLLQIAKPINGTDQYTSSSDQTKFVITNYSYYNLNEYSVNGLVKSISDPLGNITSYTYDEYGNIKTITDSEGKTTIYTYNCIGWKIQEISPLGYITKYTYSNDGQLKETILNGGETSLTEYDICGRKVNVVSPNQYDLKKSGIQCGYRYAYYNNGKLLSMRDSENNIYTYIYDKYGNLKIETKPDGGKYLYEYDCLNRLSKVSFKEDDNAEYYIITECEYSILPNKNTQKVMKNYINDTEYLTTIEIYDYAYRLIEKKDADGTGILTNYYANGMVYYTTDKLGYKTYYKYDGLNRLIGKWTPVELVNGSVSYAYEGFDYDKAGNKISEIIGVDKCSLYLTPSSCIYKNYVYYKNNKIKRLSDYEGRKTDYQYDDDGNLSRQDVYVDSTNKQTTEYEYNHMGKAITKKVHLRQGDIYGNDFSTSQDIVAVTTFTYDKNGNLKTMVNANNDAVIYGYDNLNRQISINQSGIDEYKNSTDISNTFIFNYEGKVIKNTDPNDNTTIYKYNNRGFLEEVINDTGTKLYSYDRQGRLTCEVQPNDYNNLAEITDMNRIAYLYDSMGRVITRTHIYKEAGGWIYLVSNAYKYDVNGNVLKELDGEGFASSSGTNTSEKIENGYGKIYSYNLASKRISVLDPQLKEQNYAYTTKYDYDALGRLLSETNAKGTAKKYTYDSLNNIKKIIFCKDSSTSKTIETNAYDFVGNIKTKTDANGNTTSYESNAFNKVSKIIYPGDSSQPSNTIVYQYDMLGNLRSRMDLFGTVDLYLYDSLSREISHISQKSDNSEQIETNTYYDKNGNKRFLIDGNGNTTENKYDSLNRLISTNISVTSSNGTKTLHETIYTYDKNNNLVKEVDWRGNCTSYNYDNLNRLICKTNQEGITTHRMKYDKSNNIVKSFDGMSYATEFNYDKNDRLISKSDSLGHVSKQSYDEVGNIKTKTDGNNNTTIYNYDEFNRLIEVINPKGEKTNYTYDDNSNKLTQKDGKGNITNWVYNKLNQVSKKVYSSTLSDTSKTESYKYYCNGKLSAKTDRNGNTATYIYDSHARMVSKVVGDIEIKYQYDNNNNIIQIIDSTGTTTKTYDQLNRLISNKVASIDKLVYCYDIITNMKVGYYSELLTDTKGNQVTKVYDSLNRLYQVISDGLTTQYEYYDNDSLKKIIYPNGNVSEYVYYSNGKLQAITNSSKDGTVSKYSYTYDNANSISSITNLNSTIQYKYDALNRIAEVNDADSQAAYVYDGAGNRISKATGNTLIEYLYDSQNRLTSTSTKVDGVLTTDTVYSYDNNGSTLSETVSTYNNGIKINSLKTNYTYDKLSQLVSSKLPDGTITSNIYNGEGTRVGRIVNGVLTNFITEEYIADSNAEILGDNRLERVFLEFDQEGNMIAKNIYGVNQISRVGEDTIYYYQYNGHGDVVNISDAAGNTIDIYDYDEFGCFTDQEYLSNTNYAGYIYDKEEGLYYLNSRLYNPATGRFIQEDSYYGENIEPLSLNLYTYCYNKPLAYIDPSGKWAEDVHKGKSTEIAAEMGYSKEYAKIIGEADNGVDTSSNSPYVYKNESQGWHFDRNSNQNVDSRVENSEACLNNAVSIWKNAEKNYNEKINKAKGDKFFSFKKSSYDKELEKQRKKAMKELGKGLHPLQDVDAHVDWGSDDYSKPLWVDKVHKDINGSTKTFDDSQYDLEKASGGYKLVDRKVKYGSYRYARTVKKTKDYLYKFLYKINN